MQIRKDIDIKNTMVAETVAYKNFPMVPRVVFGADSFNQLYEILMPKRTHSDAPFIFLVDSVFEGKVFVEKIPLIFNDQIIFISADEEPKTAQVDALVARICNEFAELPSEPILAPH